jgi:hypothetical protein
LVAPAVSAPAGVVNASAGFTVMDAVVADFVVSLMLIAVTITEDATVPVAISVVAGALPEAVVGETVPAPLTVKLAPEALPSLATAATRASVCPASSEIPVVGVVNEMEIGVSVTVAIADFVVSVLLVAVIVAEVVVITAGAVYSPVELIVPVLAVQVTPALAESAVTVATNVCVAPPISVAVVGLTETLIGASVTVAVADFVVSVLLVAVMVAEVVVITAGAVYTPADVIVPVVADQVTPALAESLVTVAVNVWLAPPISVAEVGLTATPIAAGEPLPPQPDNGTHAVKLARIKKKNRRRK